MKRQEWGDPHVTLVLVWLEWIPLKTYIYAKTREKHETAEQATLDDF